MKIRFALLLVAAASVPPLAHAGKGGSSISSNKGDNARAVEDRGPGTLPAVPAGAAAGSGDQSIQYLQDVKPTEIYEHHADMPEKQFSYGVFRVLVPKQGIAVAFYTPRREGRMEGRFCDVVPGATSTSSCGWTAWITDSPGGRPLCATLPDANGVTNFGAWVLGGQVTIARLQQMIDTAKVGKLGRDVCALQPHKKYYCNLTAQGWNGDGFSTAVKPGWGPLPCVGLKASSPFDHFEMADRVQESHPIGL